MTPTRNRLSKPQEKSQFPWIYIDYIANCLCRSTVYLTGNYIGILVTVSSVYCFWRVFQDQAEYDRSPTGSEFGSEMDSEDAYDLRDVSSDVEMHPDDLNDIDSDARWVLICFAYIN